MISALEGGAHDFVATWMGQPPSLGATSGLVAWPCFLFLLVVVSTIFYYKKTTDGAVHGQTSIRTTRAGTPSATGRPHFYRRCGSGAQPCSFISCMTRE